MGGMEPLLRRAVIVPTALLLAASFGGCGDDRGAGEKDTAAMHASSATGPADFADLAPEQVFKAAEDDMLGLDSLRYEIDASTGAGTLVGDIRASTDGDCNGTLQLGDGAVQVLTSGGGEWFKPDPAAWRAIANDDADRLIAEAGDNWVVDDGWEFANFCDVGSFLSETFSNGAEDEFERVGTGTLDGQLVVEIKSTDADGTTSLGYVVAEGEHHLLKVEISGHDGDGELRFSEFHQPVSAEPPAAEDIVELSPPA